MNQNDEKKSKAMRNANSYNHLGVVVLGFEDRIVNNVKQVYAVGFDLAKPDQKVAIAMMQEDGYRKNIAQVFYGRTEKTNGTETTYMNTRTKEPMTKDEYENFIKNDENLNADLHRLINSKRQAESITSKQNRISQYPAVLMFDNANNLGQVGDMKVYEARWISGLSGNTARNQSELDADKRNEQDFSVCHREVLGNIKIKYNDVGKPVWADCHAIDRISDLTSPHQTTSQEEFKDVFARNRDVLRHALNNQTNAVVPNDDGKEQVYSVERKPFTYFNLMDTNGKVDRTVTLITEEYSDSRSKEDDPIVKMHFKRPKDAPETINAYMVGQDTLSLPLQEALARNEPLTTDHKRMINQAHKADQVRAVVSSLLGTPYQPIITKELAERTNDPEIRKQISIKANESQSVHRKLQNGELTPRMINGTVYPLGHKYLERFVGEVLNAKERPIRGAFNLVEDKTVQGGARIMPYTNDKEMIFSKMYICPKKWETQSDTPSTFTGLVTIPQQSYNEVVKNRVLHTQLNQNHAPTPDSYRLISVEYKDYQSGLKQIPSLNALLQQEQERASKIENTADAKMVYDSLYRVMGIHIPNGELESKKPTQAQNSERNLKPKIEKSQDISFNPS